MKLSPSQSRPSPPTLQAETSESELEGLRKKGRNSDARGVPGPGQQWGKIENPNPVCNRLFGKQSSKATIIDNKISNTDSCKEVYISVLQSDLNEQHPNQSQKLCKIQRENRDIAYANTNVTFTFRKLEIWIKLEKRIPADTERGNYLP